MARELRLAPAQTKIKPAFTVTKLDGKAKRTIYIRDEKTRKLVTKTVEEPAGYMVRTMRGDSIRARDIHALAAMGITPDVPLIDTVTGETVGILEME